MYGYTVVCGCRNGFYQIFGIATAEADHQGRLSTSRVHMTGA